MTVFWQVYDMWRKLQRRFNMPHWTSASLYPPQAALGSAPIPKTAFSRDNQPDLHTNAKTKIASLLGCDFCFWSWWADSNCLPPHYQWGALPTELHQRCNEHYSEASRSLQVLISVKTNLIPLRGWRSPPRWRSSALQSSWALLLRQTRLPHAWGT